MSDTLIYAVRKYFGVESLSKISYSDYLNEVNRALLSANELSYSVSSFMSSYTQIAPKKDGHVRPVVIGAGFSKLNEVQIAMRSLLACNSIAILVDNESDYFVRFLFLLYFFEDYILDGSLVLMPFSFATMKEQGFGPGVFYYTAKRLQAERKLTASNFPKGHAEEMFSLPMTQAGIDSSVQNDLQGRLDADEKLDYIYASIPKYAVENGVRSTTGIAMDIVSRRPDYFDLATFRRGDMAYIQGIVEFYLELKRNSINPIVPPNHAETKFPDADRLFYLPELLDVQLPIKGVPYKYIRRIRQEDMFTNWVNSLRMAVEELAKIDDKVLLDPNAMKTTELRRYLSDSAEKLAKGVNRSQVLRRTIDVAGFGLACITGALSATSDPMVAALVGGGSFVAGGALACLASDKKATNSWRRIVSNIEFGQGIPVINESGAPFDETGMSAS